MLRILFAIIFAFTFIACEQEQLPETGMTDDETRPIPTVDYEVSSEELEEYIELTSAKHEIELESQEEMIAIVEDEGLDVQRYNQISQGVQMGQPLEDMEITPDERESYDRASNLVTEKEVELDYRTAELFEESGLDMDRYHEINTAVQQDPVLQQRLQEEIQENGGVPDQQPGRVLEPSPQPSDQN